MDFVALPISLAVASLVLLLLSLRLLFRRGWLLAFLRGFFALALFGLAAAAMLTAYDLYSYRHLLDEELVADLSFSQLGDREYRVRVAIVDGDQKDYILKGDYWQLDARFIKWKALVARSGLQPAYRLERISGRYQDLNSERELPRTVYPVSTSLGIDSWSFLHKLQTHLDFVDTQYGSATYLPMTDTAHYRVFVTFNGLIARPVNPSAEKALADWSS